MRVWLPTVLVAACLAGELALGSWFASSVSSSSSSASAAAWLDPSRRSLIITAIVGLATIAIAIAAWWSMSLRHEAGGFRVVALVPVLLSMALVVVLMLEAHHHAGARLP